MKSVKLISSIIIGFVMTLTVTNTDVAYRSPEHNTEMLEYALIQQREFMQVAYGEKAKIAFVAFHIETGEMIFELQESIKNLYAKNKGSLLIDDKRLA